MHEIGSQEGIMYSGICADITAWHVASFPGQTHMTWAQANTEHDLPFEQISHLECLTQLEDRTCGESQVNKTNVF